ncbi:MAG TPA: OsmC family protein [Candidatus Polarisedimenticolaceae bacterium]|nr:OsmC family protein [Candidatus Polarisedimenticolaceae bacterium]
MEFDVRLSGGDRVVVTAGTQEIVTDQDGSAPDPFTLFLASIGACAGYYVARFCRQRGIPTEGIALTQRFEKDQNGRVREIALELTLPDGFPDAYRGAVLRAAETCKVKRHLEAPLPVRLHLLTPV